MNKYIYRASFGLLALSMGGCASLPFMGGGQSPSPTASASPTTSPTTTATNNTASPTTSPSPGAKSPSPTDPKASPSPNAKKSPLPTPTTQASTAPGIILSTNPEERLLANNRVGNRTTKVERNPFNSIPNIPAVKIATKKVEEIPQLPKLESKQMQLLPEIAINSPPTQYKGKTTGPSVELSKSAPENVPWLPPIVPKELPQFESREKVGRGVQVPLLQPIYPQEVQVSLLPVTPKDIPPLPKIEQKTTPQWEDPNKPPVITTAPQSVPSLPPPPDTSIAENIEVSGVVEVGTQKQIIVKVPTEPTSRYVKEGQKLANGEVLVKVIQIGGGNTDPSVIFVQNGVEIVRQIGEKSTEDQKKANTFSS